MNIQTLLRTRQIQVCCLYHLSQQFNYWSALSFVQVLIHRPCSVVAGMLRYGIRTYSYQTTMYSERMQHFGIVSGLETLSHNRSDGNQHSTRELVFPGKVCNTCLQKWSVVRLFTYL